MDCCGNLGSPSARMRKRDVDVPLEFLYSPGFDWGRPWVGLGLYSGALVNGTIKTQGGSSESVMIGNKSNDNFQRFDFGYAFTMGLAIKAGFLFGLDYQHGFSRIVPDAQIQSPLTRLQTHNSVWGFHVGWVFKL